MALRLIFTLRIYFFDLIDSSVHELFFRKDLLEDSLSIIQVQSMKVLCFDLILGWNVYSVQRPELRDLEENLKSIILSILNVVIAEIKLCQLLQVLNVGQLNHSLNIVVAKEKELESFNRFKPRELLDLVLGEVQSSQQGQSIKTRNASDLVISKEELF
jgi:hypothetical protein